MGWEKAVGFEKLLIEGRVKVLQKYPFILKTNCVEQYFKGAFFPKKSDISLEMRLLYFHACSFPIMQDDRNRAELPQTKTLTAYATESEGPSDK